MTKIGLVILCVLFPAVAAAAAPPSIAVFPLQELTRGRNEVNLPFTRILAERLRTAGNEIESQETVIAFMVHNRIRTVGHLETYHISRVREELGAPFVLLGTVSQMKERPTPSMGLTLQLVRTTDARTVWTYVGHFSASDGRRVLGIGEPSSVADLHPFLLDDLVSKWPWEIINEMQRAATISIDSIVLHPSHLRPGAEFTARVRLRNGWPSGRPPRVFFKSDDQIHAASVSDDGLTFESSWIAGEKDGRFPVSLFLEWPLYGRNETALLGSYVVDGTPPLFEIDLKGASIEGDVPVFRRDLIIQPRLLVRKPIARWRLSFLNDRGEVVGIDAGGGNLPEALIWSGRGNTDIPVVNGEYEVVLEIWDEAGNSAKATRKVELNRRAPQVELAVEKNDREMTVEFAHDGRVPLEYWRMEMWTREGRILKMAEGNELPAQVGFEVPTGEENDQIQGFLMVQDVLGNRTRREVDDLFRQFGKREVQIKKEEPAAPLSEMWVDEF